ncbi:flagellar motor switch protein FliG [Candidatus Magnetominusculus xianensis]|uniref:Flagellar motor switch protein FliG n=1 Tax=Candidatus Magnetominusculus xianensis TaxID=1748249 RepID=A0ABR5SFZ6_9BACT|nr:flagellar motor switch protein FliG [Candidatus Magnetominusculus xianensis]KWT85138.1 flagellar motor switch protein FliG [Candidatus Magnetominusculus xianensis]MBF0405396.1 flagellar motor switch protein FliG [Nitrospirota bacterium]
MIELTGPEKAAIFLTAIGEDAAAEVLKSLDVKEIGKVSSMMAKIQSLKEEEIKSVFKEASTKIEKGDIYVGGGDYVRHMLTKGLDEKTAKVIMEKTAVESTLESLKKIDAKKLTNFLLTEHPQTIALILTLLDPGQAANVLTTLPKSLKVDVAMRMATTEGIPVDAIGEIEDVLKSELDIDRSEGIKVGGVKKVAQILNSTDKATEELILENIESHDYELAESIRQFMFVFEDIVRIADRDVQQILKEVSTDELSLALKTASDALKELIFKNMSKRAAEILKEDMEVKGPVRVSEVEKAQQSIIKATRKLSEAGKITLPGSGEEEALV